MKRYAGFTIVEVTITITIMAILMTLAVVNLRGSQASGRDEDRKTDISNIAIYLEGLYINGLPTQSNTRGSYPTAGAVSGTTNIETWFKEFDKKNLRAPDIASPTYSIVAANSSVQTTSGVSPQPLIGTYVYQPINQSGALCTVQGSCRKFNLFYRTENDNIVRVVTSKNQ